MSGTTRLSMELSGLEPAAAFDGFLDDLCTALARQGLVLEAGPTGGVSQAGIGLGRVVVWEPGSRLVLEWRPADWEPEERTRVEIRVEPAEGGSRVTVEHRGWRALAGEVAGDAGWFAYEVAAPFLRATTPEALGDWITDRRARRPSGAASRAVYADPLFHYPNFRVILAELALTPADYLLEVACGGGALLREALKSGCRAAAIDHSPDMVRVAREANREAIADGRLEVLEASAERLPFPDGTFTCAAMTGVLGFLADPVAALSEIRRVLRRGGRAVIMGTDPENQGTPAAPEPIASRLFFTDEAELERLGLAAGFGSVRAVRRELYAYAVEAGVPEPALPLFEGPGSRFLLARKD